MYIKGRNSEYAQACEMCHVKGTENFLGVSGGMLPRKILKSGVSERLFPVFWCANLQNSGGYKIP